MDLVVNTTAVALSSRGVRRYYAGVVRHLESSRRVQSLKPFAPQVLARPRELLLRGRRDALLWTPCQRGPLRAWHHIMTIQDCISIEHIYRNDWRLPVYRRLFDAMLVGAEAVVAISHATRAAILRNTRVPEAKIVVIQSGTDAMARPAPAQASMPAPETPFVLMVTNALPHKNTLAACVAFSRSRAHREGVALRVVGTLPAQARAACLAAGVRLHESASIDDDLLSALYAHCLFLLSPSLSEGLNLPIGEALAHGANVLCSDIDAHREFYAGGVRFFNPLREDAITAALDAALDTPGPWFAPDAWRPARTFADVAADYEALFRRIEAAA